MPASFPPAPATAAAAATSAPAAAAAAALTTAKSASATTTPAPAPAPSGATPSSLPAYGLSPALVAARVSSAAAPVPTTAPPACAAPYPDPNVLTPNALCCDGRVLYLLGAVAGGCALLGVRALTWTEWISKLGQSGQWLEAFAAACDLVHPSAYPRAQYGASALISAVSWERAPATARSGGGVAAGAADEEEARLFRDEIAELSISMLDTCAPATAPRAPLHLRLIASDGFEFRRRDEFRHRLRVSSSAVSFVAPQVRTPPFRGRARQTAAARGRILRRAVAGAGARRRRLCDGCVPY